MKVNLSQIKKLRAKTKVGVIDCRQALEECGGDLKKAEKWLKEKGLESAKKRAGRETSQGMIEVYSHAGGKIVGTVELFCETDFVCHNKEFKKTAHELAMQVAAMNPKNAKDLLQQRWIRDESQTIDNLVKGLIAKTGENIKVGRIARFELGEEKEKKKK